MKLKHKIFGGVVWNSIGLIIDNGLSMIVKLILARLLLPEDFGIIGFAVVFMGMIKVFSDMGMSAVLIQRKDEDLKPIDYDTAFWVGIIWGLFLAAIMTFAITPIASVFFNEPLLKTIIPVLSISIVLKSLTTVHIVNITREMDFKRIVLPQNISRITAAVIAIIMALKGFGVWSLVFQRVLTNLFLAFIYPFVSDWRPKMRFSLISFRKIFSFGVYTTGTKVFNYLTGNIDYLLIGKMLGASQLGIYSLAYNLTYVIRGQIMNVVNKVFYPVYSKIQDDLLTIKRYYFKVIKYNCIVIYPIMVGLILLAKPLVLIGLGEKWSAAVIPLQLMAAAGLVHLLTSSNTILLRGIGKPKLEMIMSIIKTLGVNVPFIVLGVIYYGVNGAAGGLLAAKIVIFIINNITLRKVANINFLEILDNAGSLFAITITTIILSFFINDYLILTALYGLYLFIHFRVSNKDIKQIIQLFKDRKKR
ncbi:MAG: lipopolysaccharide biosynthesis protein [Ignavibacteria bacterium]|nr:lipopolysaccharide biosynthesis protein [Ignavibacteria bacterium]